MSTYNKDELEGAFSRLESRFNEKLKEASSRLRDTCPLIAYKAEMGERCARLRDEIANNAKAINAARESLEEDMVDYKADCDEKALADKEELKGMIKGVKSNMKTLITTGVTVLLFFAATLGGVWAEKVGREEYQNHLEEANDTYDAQESELTMFIGEYKHEQERREDKIDSLLEKQTNFNAQLIEQNILVRSQLVNIESKVEANTRKLNSLE